MAGATYVISNRNNIFLTTIAGALMYGVATLVAVAGENTFNPEPVFIKGSGECEGIECADLDQDGKVDLISGQPMSGLLHFYRNIGTAGNPGFAAKVVLTDPQGKLIKLQHW